MHSITAHGNIQRSNNRMSPPDLASPVFEPHRPHWPRQHHLVVCCFCRHLPRPPPPFSGVSRPSSFQNFFSDRLGKHEVPGVPGHLQGVPLTCLPSLPDCDMGQAPEAADPRRPRQAFPSLALYRETSPCFPNPIKLGAWQWSCPASPGPAWSVSGSSLVLQSKSIRTLQSSVLWTLITGNLESPALTENGSRAR